MSMRRVSSRPRLVSDADRASQISSFMEENHHYLDTSSSKSLDSDSYFFGHDDNNVDCSVQHHVFSGEDDGRKKSAITTSAALIAGENDNDEKATATCNNGGGQPKRNTSDDTLSDYASCYCCADEDFTTTTHLTAQRDDSNLINLEMSFQKSSLSSTEDDEGGMEAAVASYMDRQLLTSSTSSTTNSTATTACVKRKRLSQQHYLTPNSSYAELHQQQQNNNVMSWYSQPSSPAVVSMKHQPYHCFTTTTNSHQHQQRNQTPLILTLPEETLIHISTHLTHNDIRSLSSTCHVIRMVVTTSTCAIENLWMERLRGCFPKVFGAADSNNDSNIADGRVETRQSRRKMHSSNVKFVDDFELPMVVASSSSIAGGLNHSNSNNMNHHHNSVNLPLLTGLLAPRYPQVMNLHAYSSVVGGGDELPLFRSFNRSIPRATTARKMTTVANNSPMMNEEEEEGDNNVVVSVIQFTGRVGTGDRSIRSDFPFPPNCRTIVSSSSSSSSSSSNCGGGGGGGASLKSLSTWMKNHTPLRSRGSKRKNGRTLQPHSMVRDLSPPPPPPPLTTQPSRYNNNRQFQPLSNGRHPLHTTGLQHLPLNSHSLNQRSPLFRFLSSLSHHCDCVDDDNEADDDGDVEDDIGSTISLDDDEIGVNDYGMTIRHNGNNLLEQCKQKLGYNNKSIKDNLRPFVVPTIVSSSTSGEDVVVDLTPRLVAYFEVTILDQRDEGHRNNERNVSQQQPQPPPPHHHAGLRPHRGYLPRPPQRRRNVPFGGHRVFHQHAILAPPLVAQDRLARRNAPNNNWLRPQRHECVAIGLSTLSFNPRSKMPGWCQNSFGYHGDDGGIFHGHGDMLRRYGPSFGPGDTVGCGFDYSSRQIFFCKNGEFLGYAFEKIDKEMVERGLYPTVGVDTECPIHVNFGEVPFKFDWKGFGRKKLYL